jgi:hypothetical protein
MGEAEAKCLRRPAQRTIPGDDDHVTIVDGLGGGEMNRVVASKRVVLGQFSGSPNERVGDLDDVRLVVELLEAVDKM